jgi:hypothetical protein
MPAIGLVPFSDVLAERDVGVVLDRDVILVVDHHQIAQLLMAGQRRRLRGEALLQVSVGGDHPDGVIEQALADGRLRVEQATLAAAGHRHPDGAGQTLPERPSGDLHPRGVPVLRVPGGERTPRPQGLQILQLEPIPAEVELDIQGQAGVAGGQHEPVPPWPVRVLRVVLEQPLVEQVRRRGQAHRRPGVTVADLLHRIGREHAHGVDCAGVQRGPVELISGVCGHGVGHDNPDPSLAPRFMIDS